MEIKLFSKLEIFSSPVISIFMPDKRWEKFLSKEKNREFVQLFCSITLELFVSDRW